MGFSKNVRWYKEIGVHIIEMFTHNSLYLFRQVNPLNKVYLINFRVYAVASNSKRDGVCLYYKNVLPLGVFDIQ